MKLVTEFISRAVEDNNIIIYYLKVNKNNMQKISKCGVYRDRDETVYCTINKCSKLSQKRHKIKVCSVGKGD